MALHPYIMSEDIRGRAGAKRFCGCTSPEKLMELVNFVAGPDSTASLYEIIRDKQRDPVNIILDLERDFTSIEALSETSRQRAREMIFVTHTRRQGSRSLTLARRQGWRSL